MIYGMVRIDISYTNKVLGVAECHKRAEIHPKGGVLGEKRSILKASEIKLELAGQAEAKDVCVEPEVVEMLGEMAPMRVRAHPVPEC